MHTLHDSYPRRQEAKHRLLARQARHFEQAGGKVQQCPALTYSCDLAGSTPLSMIHNGVLKRNPAARVDA